MASEEQRLPVFICYAHDDKRWLGRLRKHLEPLSRQGQLDIWSDRELEAGDHWHQRIQTNIKNAKAGVLLVSDSFLASKYIANSEIPVLLKNAQDKGVVIIPIILSPCLFEEARFKYPDPVKGPEELSLSIFQSANSPAEPLNKLSRFKQDEILVSVALRLQEIFGAAGFSTAQDIAPGTDQPAVMLGNIPRGIHCLPAARAS